MTATVATISRSLDRLYIRQAPHVIHMDITAVEDPADTVGAVEFVQRRTAHRLGALKRARLDPVEVEAGLRQRAAQALVGQDIANLAALQNRSYVRIDLCVQYDHRDVQPVAGAGNYHLIAI